MLLAIQFINRLDTDSFRCPDLCGQPHKMRKPEARLKPDPKMLY